MKIPGVYDDTVIPIQSIIKSCDNISISQVGDFLLNEIATVFI